MKYGCRILKVNVSIGKGTFTISKTDVHVREYLAKKNIIELCNSNLVVFQTIKQKYFSILYC